MNQIGHEEAARQQKAIEQINDQWKQKFASIGNDIQLRKWCVEHGDNQMSANEIFAFVTAPIADILTNGLPEQSGSQDPDGSKP